MTQIHENVYPYYRSPAAIRSEVFTHRMRGLDEAEVREYLDMLADQIEAGDREREELRAEIQRLRGSQLEQDPDEITPQAVALFSQAQQVADQLVDEAVRHARDLMTSARNQQREILQEAQRAAEAAAQGAEAAARQMIPTDGEALPAYTKPVPEIEYVRTFARVAQVQLRSVLEALNEQVDRLGEVPRLKGEGRAAQPDDGHTDFPEQKTWGVDGFDR